MDLNVTDLRTALIITLAMLVVYLLARRFKQRVMEKEVPAVRHAELLSLEVVYHPSRLNMVLELPDPQVIHLALLDEQHQRRFSWPDGEMQRGIHAMERALPPLADGIYYLEISTATQRTVRQFRLQ